MGSHPSIKSDSFPKQGELLGCRTEVCFHYDTTKKLLGTIVRNDIEEPYRTIIRLDDGRYVLATECQYAPMRP